MGPDRTTLLWPGQSSCQATTRSVAAAVLGQSSPSPKPTVRRPGILPLAVASSAWQAAIEPRAATRLLSAADSSESDGLAVPKPTWATAFARMTRLCSSAISLNVVSIESSTARTWVAT